MVAYLGDSMQQLLGLYKISRPFNALSGGLAVFLGGYVAGTGSWLNVFAAALATLLVTGAANAWNDYVDIEIDRINQPQRALPSGMISPRLAVFFSMLLTALALLIAALVNLPSFLIVLLFSVILYLYSWRLKSTVLIGNVTVAFTIGMTVILGGVAAGNVQPTLWLAVIIFITILGREVLKTIADYEGDLRLQVRTVATVWGRRPARVIFFLVTGLAVIMMMVPYLRSAYLDQLALCSAELGICQTYNQLVNSLPAYRPVYAYIVALGVFPVIVYILVRVHRGASGRQLERLSQILKYDFLVWFVAVVLGAAL